MYRILINTPFQYSIAEQLAESQFAKFNVEKKELWIDYVKLYELDIEQRTALGIADFFTGYMQVKFKASTRPYSFEIIFLDEQRKKIIDYQLQENFIFYKNHSYLLQLEQYKLIQQIGQYHTQSNHDEMWAILYKAQKSSTIIELINLPKTWDIRETNKLGMDLKINDDGSLTIEPNIYGISKETIEQAHYHLIEQNQKDCKILNENIDGKSVRQILNHEHLDAYHRLAKVKRVDKKDIAIFLKNPAPFILAGEEIAEDFKIDFTGYRILGMGEPYIGYFGSSPIDSPIAQALISQGDKVIIQEIKDKIKGLCQSKTIAEIQQYKEIVEDAQRSNLPQCEIADEIFIAPTYQIVGETLSKFLSRISPAFTGKEDKLVILIDPNDEITVETVNNRTKRLDDIIIDNQNAEHLFTSFNAEYIPKNYQVCGVNWLIDLYQHGFNGGILADDMGLGKTFQLIGFMDYLLNKKEFIKEGKRILIVTPTILLDNWISEINKFFKQDFLDDLNILPIRGSHLKNIKSVQHVEGKGSFNTFNIDYVLSRNPHIVITTYETLSNYQFSFVDNKFNWSCIIFDEAHKIKNPNAQISQASRAISSSCPFNVLLTGTPIENELRDLWALFDVFDPQHFGSWKQFREEYVAKTENIEQRLRAKASKYLLRRLKKDYLHELPNKFDKVHYVPFSQEEYESYQDIRCSSINAIEILHKLKSFSLYGSLLYKMYNITMEDYYFSKIEMLFNILTEIQNKNEKVILFVMNKMTQNLLSYMINQHFNIHVNIINGDSDKKNFVPKALDTFKRQEGFSVIILSTLAAGVGLTITEANHVIHYERWWNASKEDQASDRAYRIGQKKDVYIHYIISKFMENNKELTLDEAIHQLITNKRETAGFLTPPKNITASEVMDKAGIEASLTEKISAISWEDFENLVSRLFVRQGFVCEMTAKSPHEYGADIIARKDDMVLAIQCKHSQKNIVKSEEAIWKLIEYAKEYYQANQLIAVTNTEFNLKATELAQKHQVQLIEKDELESLIQQYHLDLEM